jgi:hypothetical protein
MHRYVGSCNPEQVHLLQNICNMVLKELRKNGSISLPSDMELLRDVIARRVMSQFYGEGFNADKAVLAVLESLGVDRTE